MATIRWHMMQAEAIGDALVRAVTALRTAVEALEASGGAKDLSGIAALADEDARGLQRRLHYLRRRAEQMPDAEA